MLNRRRFLLGSVASIGLAPFVTGCAAGERFAPRTAYPSRPIEIVDDEYGIPHIRAATIPDAFYGQGYVVARDRLFQLDLSHRREMGRLAEVFGPDFVRHDTAARLFHYRGDLAAELTNVPPDVLACAQAYIAGINARMDAVEADPSLLPREYQILGIRPLRWAIEDLVIGRGAAMGNADDEVRRAQLAALDLLELDAIIAPLRPAWTMTVPDGLDTKAVSEADLGILQLGGLPFGPGTPTREDPVERANAGSNAWTIAGSRTVSGRPILANDPHLGIGSFSPRHVAHLSAPGLDVIGGGAPGLPGIMQGHTDRFAFGRTNFHVDQQDLFVLELNPDDPELYRHEGGWRRFDRYEVTIPVRGGTEQTALLRYSVQGPVVSHDPSKRRATALASVGMQPGGSGSFAMIAINLSRDWTSLRRAFRLHSSPTNFHYADIDGNTGWQVIGYAPIRKKGDGLLPVPGDGRYDWTGMRDFASLPSEYNPAKGWFASANQNNLPEDWPRDRITAFSFREPYRYQRIVDVLSDQPRHSVDDSIALQLDTLSTPAKTLVGLLPKSPSAGARPAVRMLQNWNARLEVDSGAAALFQMVWRDLSRRMLDAIVPARAKALVTEIAPSVLLGLVANPDKRLGANPAAARDAMLDAALIAGWKNAQKELGNDPAKWRWGTLHKVRINHPLARIPAIAKAFPPIEGGESGGDSFTVIARWIGQGGWHVSGGSSYQQVIDVGDWDKSMIMTLPGQSIDPASPHYRDAYPRWIAGQMTPLPFSRQAVEASARSRMTLEPRD